MQGARSAPARIARKAQIENVRHKNEQGDDVFGIVMPDVAGEAVNPDEAEDGADGNRNESDENAALTHAIEKVEGWKAPDNVANAMLVEETLLGKIDDAENARKAECGVSKDTERHVKREGGAGGGWSGEMVGRRELREKKKCQDEWKHKRTDGALAMEKFEAEISKSKKPAEERHGAGEVVVGDSVETASAFEKSEIMDDQAGRQEE